MTGSNDGTDKLACRTRQFRSDDALNQNPGSVEKINAQVENTLGRKSMAADRNAIKSI